MQNSLRPETFEEFIGQERIKDTVKIILESASKRRKQPDHLLFHGPPGLGKTTLAVIIGKSMKGNTRFAQGPLLEKKADILSLFASITNGDCLFIDEIHAINKSVEELLYSAMEDGVVDVLIGPEGDQKIMRMKLPKFTIIGATTKFSNVSKPLRDRFGFIGKMNNYSNKEIIEIVKNSAKKLNIKISDEAIDMVSSHSRDVPRIANNLLKRCNDFRVVDTKKEIDKKLVEKTFMQIGLYKYGLNDLHINYLKLLANSFEEKWASIDLISSMLHEDKQNIEREIEPLLIKKALISKGARGRKITNKGIEYTTTYNLPNNV